MKGRGIPEKARAPGLLVLAATTFAAVPAARAQHHHDHHDHHDHDASEPSPEVGGSHATPIYGHAVLQIESGAAEAFGAERDYQSVALMLGLARGKFEVMAHLPAYRVEINDYTGRGLGDAHLMGRWMGLAARGTELGMFVGAMAPTGDFQEGISMGHWMGMAGLVTRAKRGRYSAALSLGYGGVLGGGDHVGPGPAVAPFVSPMNRQEIRSNATLGIGLAHGFGVSLTGLGVVPLGEGEFLGQIGGEVSYPLGRFALAMGARHGLAGHTAGLVIGSSLMVGF